MFLSHYPLEVILRPSKVWVWARTRVVVTGEVWGFNKTLEHQALLLIWITGKIVRGQIRRGCLPPPSLNSFFPGQPDSLPTLSSWRMWCPWERTIMDSMKSERMMTAQFIWQQHSAWAFTCLVFCLIKSSKWLLAHRRLAISSPVGEQTLLLPGRTPQGRVLQKVKLR